MRRRTWAAALLGGIVALILLVTFVLGIPLHMLPAVVLGGSPSVDAANAGFSHAGDGAHHFQATAANLTHCGSTCRNFTGTVRYTGTGAAANVSIDVRVTADGTEVWNATESVGRLPADAPYLLVREADIGYDGASTVLSNDGYVTVWLDIRYGGGTETLKKRLKAV